MEITTRDFVRQALAKFIPDHRTIVAIENMQHDVMNTGDALSTAEFVTLVADDNLGSERVLTGSANIDLTDGGAGLPVTLDLTDTAVTPDSYGSTTRVIILAIDQKGRITDAQEVKFDVSDVDGKLAAVHGGTGQIVYTIGDLLVADTTTTLHQLVAGTIKYPLVSNGAGVEPSYEQLDLTAGVTGVLPSANGGFPAGGFSGTVTPVTSITVVNGLVTAVS